MSSNYKAFVDVETTGFDSEKNESIQLACILTDKKLVTMGEFNQYAAPTDPNHWTLGAEKIHGISYQKACGFQKRRLMLFNFMFFLKPFVSDKPIQFIYHAKNLFDFHFVESIFKKEGLRSSFDKVFHQKHTVSTIEMANKYKALTGLSNAKLPTLTSYFNIPLNHHDAMSDTRACLEIYRQLSKWEKPQQLGFHV
jgi:DNA polymerase III epsilon subunit-like protein